MGEKKGGGVNRGIKNEGARGGVQCAMIWWHYQLLLSVSTFDGWFFKKGTQSCFLLYLIFVFSTQRLSLLALFFHFLLID